jgi:hypothetical protein
LLSSAYVVAEGSGKKKEEQMTRHISGVMLFGVALGGCASYSAYIPEESATATLGGRTAAAYSVPSEQDPQGNLRLASHGISKLERHGETGKAIHIRMALSDNGSDPFVLDARRQRLQLPDGRQLAPAYVSSAAATPPVITVRPGTSRMLDLYFPIPEDLASADRPPRFDVIWRVWAGDEEVSQVTPFDEVSVDPAVARQRAAEDVVEGYPYYDPYWGPGFMGPPAVGW